MFPLNSHVAFVLTVMVWGLMEIALALFKRAPCDVPSRRDRGSLPMLVFVIASTAAIGLTVDFGPTGRLSWDASTIAVVALALVLMGMALRIRSILTLGRYFTTNVAIQTQHRVIRDGVYRFVRHPSYSGTLLILLGIGVGCGHVIATAVVVLPSVAALLHRIRIEEELLLETFGDEYRDYRRSTYRLIPGLF